MPGKSINKVVRMQGRRNTATGILVRPDPDVGGSKLLHWKRMLKSLCVSSGRLRWLFDTEADPAQIARLDPPQFAL